MSKRKEEPRIDQYADPKWTKRWADVLLSVGCTKLNRRQIKELDEIDHDLPLNLPLLASRITRAIKHAVDWHLIKRPKSIIDLARKHSPEELMKEIPGIGPAAVQLILLILAMRIGVKRAFDWYDNDRRLDQVYAIATRKTKKSSLAKRRIDQRNVIPHNFRKTGTR